MNHPTIFIPIPSFEDPFIVDTIDSALNNASNPKNLFFVIALQYKNVKMPSVKKYDSNLNIRFLFVDVDGRPGRNQIRHNLLKYYNNEDYVLFIDSHTNFAKNWDLEVVKDYRKLQDIYGEKVLLSKQLATPPGKICSCNKDDQVCPGHEDVTMWSPLKESDIRFMSFHGYPAKPEIAFDASLEFIETNFNCHHFLFGNKDFVLDVGILDGVMTTFEEQISSFRSFLLGWRTYSPAYFSPVEHDHQKYYEELSKYPNLKRGETLGKLPNKDSRDMVKDSDDIFLELDKMFLFNTGRFRVIGAKSTPKDFFSRIGLLDHYLSMKAKFLEFQNS